MGMLAHKNQVTNVQRSCSIRYYLYNNSISFSWVDYSSCMKWHTFTVVTVHRTSQPGSKPGASCILVISTSGFCSTVSGKYLPWWENESDGMNGTVNVGKLNDMGDIESEEVAHLAIYFNILFFRKASRLMRWPCCLCFPLWIPEPDFHRMSYIYIKPLEVDKIS